MALRETENNAYAKLFLAANHHQKQEPINRLLPKITFVVDFLGKKIDLKIESLPLHLTAILKAILWNIVVRARKGFWVIVPHRERLGISKIFL